MGHQPREAGRHRSLSDDLFPSSVVGAPALRDGVPRCRHFGPCDGQDSPGCCQGSKVEAAAFSWRLTASAEPSPLCPLDADRTIPTMRFGAVISLLFAAAVLAACDDDSEELLALREEVAELRTQVSAASAASPGPGTPLASTPTPTATFTPTATATPEPPTATPTPPPPPPPPPPTPMPAATPSPRLTAEQVRQAAYRRFGDCVQQGSAVTVLPVSFDATYVGDGVWNVGGPGVMVGGYYGFFEATLSEVTMTWLVVFAPPECR
ncbi:hypothetical protein A9A59_2423 [Tepidiforma thermophila]|uniref:Uncharacterized protein n=1 Tax=Tepidiforma thermophila (strain KCTC 52669 / CGMCC 1.13589 / G233) TaxID=2761530 RepID=A0A2A9HGK3_TEPT2|nr:hypothetical protein A9A59_2423 [Tepidiforma thermophila]